MDIAAALTNLVEAVGRVDSRLGGVESRLGGVESRLGGVETRLGRLETRLGGVDTRLAEVETHIKSQPDLRLLMEPARTTLDRMVHMEGEMRMLRSAINDHARENVTPGEMAAVHHDLDLM